MTVKFGADLTYFFWSVGTGFIFAVFYDFIRVIRRMLKASDLIINLTDVIILILCGFVIMTEAYFINNGELRVYSILCMVLIFLLYRLLIGNRLSDMFEAVIGFIINIIIIPARAVAGIVKMLVNKTNSIKDKVFDRINVKKAE